MKQFINWAIDAILPGEFDEGQGRYVFYPSHYYRHGYFVSLKHRSILLASWILLIPLFMLFYLWPQFNETIDEDGHLVESWAAIQCWAAMCFFFIKFCIQCRVLSFCEQSPFNRPLPRLIYLYLLIDILGLSLLVMIGFMAIHLHMYILVGIIAILFGVVRVVRCIFRGVDIYKNAILDKNII